MSRKRLIDLIKSYEGNEDVQVDIYLKDGQKTDLKSVSVTHNALVAADGSRFPHSKISHAEIYAL